IDEPGDWNLWRRFQAAGIPMGFVDHVVARHYRERREIDARQPFWLGQGLVSTGDEGRKISEQDLRPAATKHLSET
ncbi:MAG: hypothetical protein ACYTG5_06540, partial [Planctomycetota bacterium]